ncbi:hypothetical protein GOODEAATRI_023464 [Goodea atripinnis]|uniref:Uncharacterized protein n=1 Tax=Goodea atripinnis TaxID=208336 RepID=A0ABV0MW28_9TELE
MEDAHFLWLLSNPSALCWQLVGGASWSNICTSVSFDQRMSSKKSCSSFRFSFAHLSLTAVFILQTGAILLQAFQAAILVRSFLNCSIMCRGSGCVGCFLFLSAIVCLTSSRRW